MARFIFLFSFLVSFLFSFADNTDSLWTKWNNNQLNDSLRLSALDGFIWKKFLFSNPDSALILGGLENNYATENNIKFWEGKSLKTIGAANYFKGSYAKALADFYAALNIMVDLEEKREIAGAYNLIGIVHKELEEYNTSLFNYNKSIAIYRSLNDSAGIGKMYNNLGEVFFLMGKYDTALFYHKSDLVIQKSNLNNRAIAISLSNIGKTLLYLKDYDSALIALNKSLKIREKIGELFSMANSLERLAATHYKMGNFKQSEAFAIKALEYAEQAGVVVEARDANFILHQIYEVKHPKKALYHYKNFIELRDSIKSLKVRGTYLNLKHKLVYDLNKKTDSIHHADELIIQEEKLKTAKTMRNSLILGIVFAVVLLVVLSAFLIIIRKQFLKTKQQKSLIEIKQKDITDSINYAKKIQDALMNSDDVLNSIFSESFVFFQPKDVVSGDFFWSYKSDDAVFFTVADCTGHGVPGAFMSMIGISLLNELVIENKLSDPAQILNNLREQIVKSLHQKGIQGEARDGMDMALCKLNIKTLVLEYSGAYNPLIRVKNNALLITDADHQPVALQNKIDQTFTKHEIQLEKGEIIYLFSDGFIDQFGGPKNKKYMRGRFKKLLLSIHDKKLSEQRSILENEFNTWKQDYEQIDDVCVMGLKI